MSDLNVLTHHRDALLLAEVAAWLHNIGKLDPNFLVIQTNESPTVLGELYRVPPENSGWSGYSIRRFCRPSVLQSDFPYEHLVGVLYFPDVTLRQEIEDMQSQLSEFRSQLESLSEDDPRRPQLGKQVQEMSREFRQRKDDLIKNERDAWKQFEQKFETLELPELKWPLGSLLTMFWENEWFDKPNINNYEPGSEHDPDYQRTPKPNIRLKPEYTMEWSTLLLLTHGEVSGQEKRGFNPRGRYVTVNDYGEKTSSLEKLRLATAFGYETPLEWKEWQVLREQIADVISKSWNNPVEHRESLYHTFQLLGNALGDTQRPINEISLFDYSRATASLFKAAVAQKFLADQIPTPSDMHWRLASIRLDAFDFLFQVNQLSDLLARRQLLRDAHSLIQHLLEVEVPFGTEVYADEHGPLFVLPGLPDWSIERVRQTLAGQIRESLDSPQSLETFPNPPTLYGASDIRPAITVGQPRRGKKLNLQEALPEEEIISTPSPKDVAEWWQGSNGDTGKERCAVCGLRPAGHLEPNLPGFVTPDKAEERGLCGVCLARRGRRAQEWARAKSDETIWIDEVADADGRVALFVGRFDLEEWLNGALVGSLAVGTDEDGNWLSKPPTFARIQRVWRTTAQFWRESREAMTISLQDDRRRLRLWLDRQPDLGHYHTYELDLGATTMSIVWIPPQREQEGYFISVDNLQYVAKLIGAEEDIHQDAAASAIFVEDFIKRTFVENGQLPHVRNPESTGAGRKVNLLRGYSIVRTDYQETAYSPAIPILTEPRTFMALVPANRALDVVTAIKEKYEREMGKVRNRLPLHLGLVYARRRTPLRAVLDAGRRMLTRTAPPQRWKVVAKMEDDTLPAHLQGDGHFARSVALRLKHDGREFTWHVPLTMGDGTTPDHWYPYVFIETRDGAEPADRRRYFKPFSPPRVGDTCTGRRAVQWGPEEGSAWLVHAGDLEAGDVVHFTPATFDVEWLDSAARRFEIAYDDAGRRRSAGTRHRPYLLDELVHLDHIWNTLAEHLTQNQIHALRDLVEAKREQWHVPFGDAGDTTFRRLCRAALADAEWRQGRRDERAGKLPWEVDDETKPEWLDEWTDYAARSWLTDAIDLYS